MLIKYYTRDSCPGFSSSSPHTFPDPLLSRSFPWMCPIPLNLRRTRYSTALPRYYNYSVFPASKFPQNLARSTLVYSISFSARLDTINRIPGELLYRLLSGFNPGIFFSKLLIQRSKAIKPVVTSRLQAAKNVKREIP